MALIHLPSVHALFNSGWGRILLVKLALVAATAAIGGWNWRRVRPTLGASGSSDRLQKSARAELAVGAMVVLATAVLVGLPLPR